MNLLLLVGIAFLLLVVGTLLGRYYAPDRRPLERAAEEGKSYVRGLVEVLDGRSDRAVAEIAEALKHNTKTVEAYFALGSLFRSRGEHERAVRVHQAILVRRDIDKATRLKVYHQLALDFRAAGFPRRAAKALEMVVTQDGKQAAALEELCKLYEETGEWERAALGQKRLGKLAGRDTRAVQAHLYAELAAGALEQQDLAAARKALKRALSADAGSVHALHVLGRYHATRENRAAAVAAWERGLRARPELAAFFVPLLEDALFALGKLEALDRLLDELRREQPGNVQLRLAHARLDAKRNPARALAELSAILDEAPGLIPAWREKARLQLERGDAEELRRGFEDLLALLARADRGYRCGSCGHTAAAHFWRCPSCASWDSARSAWGRRAGEGAAPPSALVRA
jgi:lipopolysaccharide biosynthesis regulator YciM